MQATVKATTVGVFATREAAERAVADLKAAGYRDDQIGMVAKNAAGTPVHTDGSGASHAGEGAAIGAVAGAVTTAGLGAAMMAGVIPVIGPILALGPLAVTLLNVAGGAAAGTLAGALIGWGIPEEDAGYYEGEVAAGRYLVTVDAGARGTDARSIYARHGGYDRSTAPAATGTAGRTVQLKEETLHATKQPVRAGEVEVRKEVHTEHKTITVPVEREEVVIERRPVSGTAAAGDIKAEEIRIPTREEKVHVSKEAVVKEEVNVGKRTVRDTETVSGDVRKEELKVEQTGDARVRQTGGTDRK